jgi:transposase
MPTAKTTMLPATTSHKSLAPSAIRRRTQLANAIRGYAWEFGTTVATGMCRIEPLLDSIAENDAVPSLARELFALHAGEYMQLKAEIERVEEKLMEWHRENECSQRLAHIPGIGPIGASLLMMKTPDPRLFKSGRDFAAWIGLTPRDHSTAGKVRSGGITRAGDELLRSTLVGATAVIRQVRQKNGRHRVVQFSQLKRDLANAWYPPKAAAYLSWRRELRWLKRRMLAAKLRSLANTPGFVRIREASSPNVTSRT